MTLRARFFYFIAFVMLIYHAALALYILVGMQLNGGCQIFRETMEAIRIAEIAFAAAVLLLGIGCLRHFWKDMRGTG